MYEKSNTYLENLEAFQAALLENSKASFPSLHAKTRASLEKSILRASDQYVSGENRSLWGQEWFDDAYLAYFLFTQSARLYYTFWRTREVFNFEQIAKVVDCGSGPSTAKLAFHGFWGKEHRLDWINIDSSKAALKYGKRLEEEWGLKSDFLCSDQIPDPKSDKELLLLSFSNCEGLNFENVLNYHNILILEPGQQSFSRKLIEFRSKALTQGFSVLAPCSHQEGCPMQEGKKNWCHDTAPKPSLLNSFDLPFSKNRLNFSYLFLSKNIQSEHNGLTRVVGDMRFEKGKTKVAVCRGKSAEFLSWLKKSKLELQLNRGDLIALPSKLTTKGQEVRIEEPLKPLFKKLR